MFDEKNDITSPSAEGQDTETETGASETKAAETATPEASAESSEAAGSPTQKAEAQPMGAASHQAGTQPVGAASHQAGAQPMGAASRQAGAQFGQPWANPQGRPQTWNGAQNGAGAPQYSGAYARPGQGFSQPLNTGTPQYGTVGGQTAQKKSIMRPIAVTALCALVAGVVFAAAFRTTGAVFKDVLGDNRDIETTTTYINKIDAEKTSDDLSVETIVEGCLPSIVSITNKGISEVPTFFGNIQQESVSTGTGIIIGKNDTELLIVTNYHVVAGARELTVVFAHDGDGKVEENAPYMDSAQVKGYDADKDIAVIAVKLSDIDDDTMSKIAVATIGDSNSLKMGSGVIAIGNALGYGQSTTRGIVSAVGREITIQNANGEAVTNKYIQTDAAINKGNSGGALLDMHGALIGINSAKITASGVEGMGYAIPISDVEELIGELMNEKTREEVDEANRGYLGITGVDISESTSALYGIPEGVMIDTVVEGSPAEKAGLKKRDIITKLDRTTISSMNDLKGRLAYYEKGEKVTLTVMRPNGAEYEETTIDLTLGSSREAGIDE